MFVAFNSPAQAQALFGDSARSDNCRYNTSCVVGPTVNFRAAKLDANCRVHYTLKDFHRYMQPRAKSPKPLTPGVRKTAEKVIRCQRYRRNQPRLRRHERRYLRHHAFRVKRLREYEALTPYSCPPHGRYALPCWVVNRESRFDPRARNPTSTAGGLFQFLDTTWAAFGGTDYPGTHDAAQAPAMEQQRIGARAWAGGAGCSHWMAC